MKDIKGYKQIKQKKFKLKTLKIKREILINRIQKCDFDDYERIIKKGKELKNIESEIEKLSEELKKYVSFEDLEENPKEQSKTHKAKREQIQEKRKENQMQVGKEVPNQAENYNETDINHLREHLKDDDEIDRNIEKSIEEENYNMEFDESEKTEKKNEKKFGNKKTKVDKKAEKIVEEANFKINDIKEKIKQDKEKREKCEEKLEELKNLGVRKVFAVKIAEAENNETAIKKFSEDLDLVKQEAKKLEIELYSIQSRIMMNQLRQSEIRKEAFDKIEIRQAVDSIGKNAFGKAIIYTKAAAIAVARSVKETFNKIKEKLTKNDNNLKLNSGKEDESVKIYEPKTNKNNIKSKYNQEINYSNAYNNANHNKKSDNKEVTDNYRD